MNIEKIESIIRNKINEMAEYCYGDGCVLFDLSFCNEDELKRLNDSGMLDTLVRVLTKEIYDNSRKDYKHGQ